MARKLFIALHRFAALYAGVFIMLLGLSGCILIFETNIDHMTSARLLDVSGRDPTLPIGVLLQNVQKAFPDDRVATITLPERPNSSHQFSLAGGLQVYVDGHTGEILGSRLLNETLAYKLHHYHEDLLAGRIGSILTGLGSFFLLFLTLSGLVLWWKRKIISVRKGTHWARTAFDAHHAVGICSSVVFLALTVTGMIIVFSSPTPPLPMPASAVQDEDAQRVTLEAALRVADAALPGARAATITIPANADGSIRVTKKYPNEASPTGRSRVYVDQFSGKLLSVEDARLDSLGTRITRLTRPIHTGAIYGWPTRIVALVGGLMVMLQVVTGFSMWWRRVGSQRIGKKGATVKAISEAVASDYREPEIAARKH